MTGPKEKAAANTALWRRVLIQFYKRAQSVWEAFGVFVLITFRVQTFSLVIEFLAIFMKSKMKTKRKQKNLISYNRVLLLVAYKCKIVGP